MGGFFAPFFEIFKMFFIQNKNVMVGHLFVWSGLVDWFRNNRHFFEFLKGGRAFLTPHFEILKMFLDSE